MQEKQTFALSLQLHGSVRVPDSVSADKAAADKAAASTKANAGKPDQSASASAANPHAIFREVLPGPILGKCLKTDPYENEHSIEEHVVYVAKKWLSVPVKVWMPNLNLEVLMVVLAFQAFLTWAAYYTSHHSKNGCAQCFMLIMPTCETAPHT
jgi:hypothetical protein